MIKRLLLYSTTILLLSIMVGCASLRKDSLYGDLISEKTTGAETEKPSVTLAWDANSETNLAGYKLYYATDDGVPEFDGIGATNGDSPITITLADLTDASLPVYELYGLDIGSRYWFALTAFDTDSMESDYSDVVTTIIDGGVIDIGKIGNIRFQLQ